jgi:multicomponent Na+:H+ antiporter subunit G
MDTLLNLASSFCLLLGSFLCLSGGVGILRFPDFYTRMHAAGKGDTLSSLLILLGFGLITLDDFSMVGWLLVVKLLAIVLFIMLTSPTSTHALMRAGYEDGVEPVTKRSPSTKKTNKEAES